MRSFCQYWVLVCVCVVDVAVAVCLASLVVSSGALSEAVTLFLPLVKLTTGYSCLIKSFFQRLVCRAS